MCRLYGFHANEETKVECSLVHAQNALLLQSRQDQLGRANPHGWGLAFYVNAHPTVVRQATAAFEDLHFSETAERIYTRTVVAHVRYATVGKPSLLNSHPFDHGVWTLAHNGTVTHFAELREQLIDEMDPGLRRFVGGVTDSEHVFYWLLSRLAAAGVEPDAPCTNPDAVADLLAASVAELAARCDAFADARPARLNLLLTDGQSLFATRWGNSLYLLERDGVRDCEICGIPHIHHDQRVPYRAVVIASEPVTHETWQEVPDRSVIRVDGRLQVRNAPIAAWTPA